MQYLYMIGNSGMLYGNYKKQWIDFYIFIRSTFDRNIEINDVWRELLTICACIRVISN